MQILPERLPELVLAIEQILKTNQEEITELDQAIGDGDHVTNLLRGVEAVKEQSQALSSQDWSGAWQKIGMILLSKMGGASGSLLGTLFISMGKEAGKHQAMNLSAFADVFYQGVEAVKRRGKAEAGEKTLLDVLIPVAEEMRLAAGEADGEERLLKTLCQVAESGVESTRDMLATKGRASFLGERSIGHLDAGAKTSQLMICAVINGARGPSAAPA